jgi:uncharacterized protein YbaR (Trm112 family)
MLEKITKIIACPLCKSELKLSIDEQNNEEIIIGNLLCINKSCNKKFYIKDGIPNFIT